MERSVKDLAAYRYDCCTEALEDASIMYRAGRYKNTLNRAYYAIFYGIRAVNALDGFDSSKHSGVIAHFNQYYVKTGIFPREASKIIKLASESREHADYLDFYIASGKDAAEHIHRAGIFAGWIREYLISNDVICSD